MPIEAMVKLALTFLLALAANAAGGSQPKEEQQHRIIPIRKMSHDVEILYGDPEKAGEPFVMRIRELPGGIIPPHTHPVDEHITVLQGTFYFAVGEKFDHAALKEMKAGSYAFIPKGSSMFGYTPNAAIVQVHGVGPFHIHWSDGYKDLDASDAAATFKFKKGERVVAKRGRGRINEGYANGSLIQYVIEGDNGQLFMVQEKDLKRR
jgi:quercetin dioxygenase-like cupin family protein